MTTKSTQTPQREVVLFLDPKKHKQHKNIKPFSFPWEQNVPRDKVYYVSELIKDYLHSDLYVGLSANSQKTYLTVLTYFEKLILYTNKNIYAMRAHKVDYSTVDYLKMVMGHAYKQSTIKLMFTVMQGVWEHAIRKGRLNFNPWRNPNIKVDNERDTTWSREQVQSAIDKAKELGYGLLALYILVMYETAQRPWEDLRDLKWDNYQQNENGEYYFDFIISKTRTHIILPLSCRVSDALAARIRVSEYIFVTKTGKRPDESGMRFQLNKVRAALGLPTELKFRDLRRTAITELAESGATVQEIEAMTGWKCSDGVIRRYARMRYRTAQNALEKREALRAKESVEVRTEPKIST